MSSTARSVALRLLTRRDYTTAELRDKLTERAFDRDEIDATLASLTDAGLLDDRRVAGAYIRTATRTKSRGRLRIQRELDARGVARDLIRELLADLPPEDESAAIERFLARRPLPPRPTPADRQRLFQRLLRRGFPPEAIRKALAKR